MSTSPPSTDPAADPAAPGPARLNPLLRDDPPKIGGYWLDARLTATASGVAYAAHDDGGTQAMLVLLSEGAAEDAAARDRLAGAVNKLDIDTVLARGGHGQDAGRLGGKFVREDDDPRASSDAEASGEIPLAPWVALAFDGTTRATDEASRLLAEVDLSWLPAQGRAAGPDYELYWVEQAKPGIWRLWPLPWPGRYDRSGPLSILASWLLMLLLMCLAVLLAILLFQNSSTQQPPPPVPTSASGGSGSPSSQPPTSGSASPSSAPSNSASPSESGSPSPTPSQSGSPSESPSPLPQRLADEPVSVRRRRPDHAESTVIRLVASDLDGTLLAPNGTIPIDTVEALREVHAAGVQVVVATGRPIRWLDCLQPLAALCPHVLASNGAVDYDLSTGRTRSQHAFDAETVRELTRRVRAAVPEACFGLERGDVFGAEVGAPSDHADLPGVLQLPVDELTRRIQPVVKMIAYSNQVGSDVLTSRVAAAVGSLATVTTSMLDGDFGMAELSVPGVTKGTALADLCGRLGISAEEVIAFGDMPNDVDMLTWVGHGCVTANGHPDLRARFEVVGSCAEGGVGKHLRGLLK